MLANFIRSAVGAMARRAGKGSRRPAEAPRLFCAQPFTRFEVLGGDDRGLAVPCCQSWITKSFGNISDRSVEEVWNSAAAQEFRTSILDGSFRHCKASLCPYLQRVEGPVQRLEDVSDEQLLEIIRRQLTVLPFGPRDVVCCFDQSCNLSCPSCRTQMVMETANADAIGAIREKLENEALGDARMLYITGSGDPFGSPYFRRWLQTMKRSSMPRLERIHLHTNGLLWTPRIWESIPEETRALVTTAQVSIDAATPATYLVNRRGGDFDTLLKRLAFISSLRREGPLKFLEIHMTVQANNFREMPAFVELGKRHGVDRVAFHQLMNWGTYTPEEYDARAVHVPTHSDHEAFLETLSAAELDDPVVYMSNLTEMKLARGRDNALQMAS